ncbi:MAG: PAS domain S-box protein [Nitrospirota bacterium]
MLTTEHIKWKEIFNAIGHPSCIFDTEFNILSINTAASKLLNKSEDEVRGKKCYKLFHGFDEPVEGCPLKKMIASGQFKTVEIEIEAFNGTFLVSCSPLYDKEGNLKEVIHIATDITDRKNAKKELAESEYRYRSFVQNFQGIAFRGNMNFMPIFFHGAVEEITGYTEEEFVIGKPRWDQLIHSDDASNLKKSFEKVCHVPDYSTEREYRIMHKNGQIRWVHELIKNICDSSGKPVYVHGMIYDITVRKKAEEELKMYQNHLHDLVKEQTAELTKANEQLQLKIAEHKLAEERKTQLLKEVKSVNKELREFIYVVSHDLKSPLRAIGSLTNWISNDYANKLGKEGKEQLQLLVKRVMRMYALIEGILAYSKIEHVKEKKVKVNINELLEEVIDMTAPPENIKITFENELPSILCEKTRIMQVFQNLLSNAVGYMDKPQGLIKIGCIEDNSSWRFSIADNGPGIEEKYFEKIFKIFQTLSPPDKQEDTGVGLTIVKKIITMYGGKIWVKSKVGQGSTFFFTLPKKLVNNPAAETTGC